MTCIQFKKIIAVGDLFKNVSSLFHMLDLMLIPETGRVLEEAIHNDNLVISVKHIKPRRRARSGVETLLAVDFPGSQQKLVLQLDRRLSKSKFIVC